MWIADGWEDYELLDCGGGEKLERWGKQILVRPDPQAIWETPRTNRGWRNVDNTISPFPVYLMAGATRRAAITARPRAADIGTRRSCPRAGR